MTSQIIGSGKHKRETALCSMESKKDDSPLKARFLAVRKEIFNRYTEKQQTEHQAASEALKRGMSEREREALSWGLSDGVERSSAWKRFDLGFDFFSDPLKWLVLLQDDAHGGMCASFSRTCAKCCFIMDKAFCHMEHDDAARKDPFPSHGGFF
jgi:hypothetical protein